VDRERERELLEDAIDKQTSLRENSDEWDRLIPNDNYPPILWFGDSTGEGPSVVTVAANPSHKEYLNESRNDLESKLDDHSQLERLEDDRLHVPEVRLSTIEKEMDEAEKIVKGYDQYFKSGRYSARVW
jgi:hypothetical protein